MEKKKNDTDIIDIEIPRPVDYVCCIHHGWTPCYKNGKCKECVKYQRFETLLKNRMVKKGY